jgi:hypothetical protein
MKINPDKSKAVGFTRTRGEGTTDILSWGSINYGGK